MVGPVVTSLGPRIRVGCEAEMAGHVRLGPRSVPTAKNMALLNYSQKIEGDIKNDGAGIEDAETP